MVISTHPQALLGTIDGRNKLHKQVVRALELSHKRKYKSGLMLLEQLVLQFFQHKNVAKTNGFTTSPNIMLLKPMVLQHFQKQGC